MPLSEAAAYRAAAARYLTAEAWRWAAQLRLDHLVWADAPPAAVEGADAVNRAAAAALCDATLALELCEAELRAAIPIPLPLEKLL